MAASALVVAIIAVTPLVRGAVERNSELHATFVQPTSGQAVHGETVPTQVTVENLGNDEDVWLVLRAGEQGRWYPIVRIQPDGSGAWMASDGEVVLGTTGTYQLLLYGVRPPEAGAMQEYVESAEANGHPGLTSLPVGVRLLDAVDIRRTA